MLTFCESYVSLLEERAAEKYFNKAKIHLGSRAEEALGALRSLALMCVSPRYRAVVASYLGGLDPIKALSEKPNFNEIIGTLHQREQLIDVLLQRDQLVDVLLQRRGVVKVDLLPGEDVSALTDFVSLLQEASKSTALVEYVPAAGNA
jgi:hypothetical protein